MTVYNPKGSAMINRCRLYLQAISLYDILTYDLHGIHPSYKQGECPPSRHSTIHWPNNPKPPKNYWQLWCQFLHIHLQSYISSHNFSWSTSSSPRYVVNSFKHSVHHQLFQYTEGQMCHYNILHCCRSESKAIYNNVPYISAIPHTDPNLWSVDTYYTKKGIIVIGRNNINNHKHKNASVTCTLQDRFATLPHSLRDIVGHVTFPLDNGVTLIWPLNEQISPCLFGASDASCKSRKTLHAWILSSGSPDDITDPMRNISGGGIVHGNPLFLSSGRGELHGILALFIVADMFKKHYSSTAPIRTISDNQGVTSKCNNMSITSLRSHRSPNIDLYIMQQHITIQNKISHEWIKGHSDKAPWESIQDLKEQGLNCEEIYNV